MGILDKDYTIVKWCHTCQTDHKYDRAGKIMTDAKIAPEEMSVNATRQFYSASVVGTSLIQPLDLLTVGRDMPKGCDTWGMKSVTPDFTTYGGYKWTWPGNWAVCPPKSVMRHHKGACPSGSGDGLCYATSFKGMSSGSFPARLILLLAFDSNDVLGVDENAEKGRVSRMFVVDLIDGEKFIRKNASKGLNLKSAMVPRFDFSYTDFGRSNLAHATLKGSNFTSAKLHQTTGLFDANLNNAHYDSDTTFPGPEKYWINHVEQGLGLWNSDLSVKTKRMVKV